MTIYMRNNAADKGEKGPKRPELSRKRARVVGRRSFLYSRGNIGFLEYKWRFWEGEALP